MIYGLILVLATLQAGLYAPTPKMESGNIVGKMCGQVTLVQVSGTSYSSRYQREPVKKADVLIYRRIRKRKCCALDELVAQTPTDSSGGFEFKKVSAGDYWVVVVVGNRRNKLAVTLSGLEEKSQEDCSVLDYEVINGRALRLERMYRVH